MSTITEEEYISTVKRMYPDMSDEEIKTHLDKALRDENGQIIRGEDMFDFSGLQ
jgi:hypothetical protein